MLREEVKGEEVKTEEVRRAESVVQVNTLWVV
jgi:hypothetical protein